MPSLPKGRNLKRRRKQVQNKNMHKYNRAAYKKARTMFLKRYPLCYHYLQEGRAVPATELDHIIPISQGGSLLDRRNFQPLSKSAHTRKTTIENKNGGSVLPYRLNKAGEKIPKGEYLKDYFELMEKIT